MLNSFSGMQCNAKRHTGQKWLAMLIAMNINGFEQCSQRAAVDAGAHTKWLVD